MLLLRLKIRNFLVYEEVDLDLRDVKLASIVGQFVTDRRRSNGSGKTALLEAIRYAIYDQTRSKLKLGIVRTGARNSLVELEFMLGAKRVKVLRTRNEDGASNATLHIDGKPAGDKVKVVNELLERMIGVSADLFDQIYFFKQGDQFAFAEANPADRKVALSKVFRLDALIRCADIAKERKKDAEAAVQRASSVAINLGSRNVTLPPYHQLLEEELAISGNLATALQLQCDYEPINQDNILSRANLEQMSKELEEEITKDTAAIKEIEGKIKQINGKIVERQQSSQQNTAKAAQLTAQIDEIDKEFGSDKLSVDDINNQIVIMKIDIAAARAARDAASNDLAITFNSIKALGKVDMSSVAGQECPTCHQFVGVDHIEAVHNHILKETKTLRDLSTQQSAIVKEVNDRYDALTKKLDKLNASIWKRSERESIAGMRDYNIADAKKDDKLIEEMTDQRNTMFFEQSQAVQRVDTGYIAETRKTLSELGVRFKNLFSNIGPTRNSSLRTDSEKLIAAHRDILAAIKERKTLDEEIGKNDKLLTNARADVIVFNHLDEAFGKNGIQALLIENAIGVIETFANDVLRQMQTRFIVALRTQKETKAGELRESLDIIVFDNGVERAFESYSGGERTMINIALRLSLSKVIGSLYGVQMDCLFLDEVLAQLDVVNREETIKVISFLAKSFQQVFIISHTSEIVDYIDSSILITRGENKSDVKIVSVAKSA